MLNCSRRDIWYLLIHWPRKGQLSLLPCTLDLLNYFILEVLTFTLGYKLWDACGTISLLFHSGNQIGLFLQHSHHSEVCPRYLWRCHVGQWPRHWNQTDATPNASCGFFSLSSLGICPLWPLVSHLWIGESSLFHRVVARIFKKYMQLVQLSGSPR